MFGFRNEGDQPGFAWAGGHGGDGPRAGWGWQERGPWGRGHHKHHGHHHGHHEHQDPRERFGPEFGGYGQYGPYGGYGPGFGRGFGPGFGPGFGRMAWHMARRFGFGPGTPPMGPRMFGRGDLKYALLDSLKERPKHGYEMIKELEEKSGGFYTPSAGAVYPTLQMLEDREWVTSQTLEGKKVYTLTDAGRGALEEHQSKQQAREEFGPRGPREWGEHKHGRHGGPFQGWGGPFGGPGGPFGREARPELGALGRESMEVARLMRAAVLASGGNTERLARLRAIVERTKGDLNEFLGQAESQSGEQPTGDGPVENL